MITSYDWNGKDSTNSSADFISWKDNSYYLGKDKNWKVSALTNTAVKMIPDKASNDITWQFTDSSNWSAILVSNKGTNTYLMQRFDPFTK